VFIYSFLKFVQIRILSWYGLLVTNWFQLTTNNTVVPPPPLFKYPNKNIKYYSHTLTLGVSSIGSVDERVTESTEKSHFSLGVRNSSTPDKNHLRINSKHPNVIFFTPQTQEHYMTMTQTWMTSHSCQIGDVFSGFLLNQGYSQ
jgi:hypothetical protein